jgi:hypothetical protein
MITEVSSTIKFALHLTCRYAWTNDLKFKMARYFLFSKLILNVITALLKKVNLIYLEIHKHSAVKRWEM